MTVSYDTLAVSDSKMFGISNRSGYKVRIGKAVSDSKMFGISNVSSFSFG